MTDFWRKRSYGKKKTNSLVIVILNFRSSRFGFPEGSNEGQGSGLPENVIDRLDQPTLSSLTGYLDQYRDRCATPDIGRHTYLLVLDACRYHASRVIPKPPTHLPSVGVHPVLAKLPDNWTHSTLISNVRAWSFHALYSLVRAGYSRLPLICPMHSWPTKSSPAIPCLIETLTYLNLRNPSSREEIIANTKWQV